MAYGAWHSGEGMRERYWPKLCMSKYQHLEDPIDRGGQRDRACAEPEGRK